MLSYRHAFHAGNFADVLKHWVLVEVLQYLTQKPKSMFYLDTHAGTGGYALMDEQAQKNAEFNNGIGALWQAEDLPSGLSAYVNLMKDFNRQSVQVSAQARAQDLAALEQNLCFYPGSPWIAQAMLREQDRGQLFELHPQDSVSLQALFKGDRRIRTFVKDGFEGLIAALPPKERRGLVLIDPPYEMKSDYERVVDVLQQANKRFATGTYALWYPVVERGRIDQLERALQASGVRNIELYEMGLYADSSGRGMTASGMIVINPPWTLKARMLEELPILVEHLAPNSGFYRVETLVEE